MHRDASVAPHEYGCEMARSERIAPKRQDLGAFLGAFHALTWHRHYAHFDGPKHEH